MLRVLPFVIGLAAVMVVTGQWDLIAKVVQAAGQWLWPYVNSFLQSIGANTL